MAGPVVNADDRTENTGYRFSWALAIVGGVVATATTFFLLTLGSGFGLLLLNPSAHTSPAMPVFLTAGAIYFVIAQAFGFAVGGHIAGRLIGGLSESKKQEEFRAEAHGLAVWAVAVLATLTVVAIVTLSATNSAALYGVSSIKMETTPSAYLVDILFRPAMSRTSPTDAATVVTIGGSEVVADTSAQIEARRIVDAGLGIGIQLTAEDRERLIQLVSRNAAITGGEAASRVDRMQAGLTAKAERVAAIARKSASYTALWIALSLLFGMLVSVTAAVAGRDEDDEESLV